MRLRLLLAYDGRPFAGWQSQAHRGGVQDHLEAAFLRVLGEKVSVQGAGRTDAGVHALGQVAHAEVPPRLPAAAWQGALNAYLPAEIRVLRAARAPAEFHARFQARGKIYRYRIWNGPFLHPMEIGRAWHVPGALELAEVRRAAKVLEGRHDFAGFAANRGIPPKETVRNVSRIAVTRTGPRIELRFEGEGFLYKMVRLLTGSIIRCAQGKADEQWLRGLLAGGGQRKSHFMAPAEGLYLARVLY